MIIYLKISSLFRLCAWVCARAQSPPPKKIAQSPIIDGPLSNRPDRRHDNLLKPDRTCNDVAKNLANAIPNLPQGGRFPSFPSLFGESKDKGVTTRNHYKHWILCNLAWTFCRFSLFFCKSVYLGISSPFCLGQGWPKYWSASPFLWPAEGFPNVKGCGPCTSNRKKTSAARLHYPWLNWNLFYQVFYHLFSNCF